METNLTYKCYEQNQRCGYTGCSENGPRIPTIAKKGGEKRVIGRKIIDVSRYLGSYGMGGPGFFGFKLEKKGRYPTEWLVLTMWAADQWLLLNGKWLDCNPEHFNKDKCYFSENISNFHEANEQVKDFFIGLTIDAFSLKNRSFIMVLSEDEIMGAYTLELPNDLNRLPPYGNGEKNGEKRKWNTDEKLESRFLISKTEFINI